MAKRKQRVRSSHPGVKLKKRTRASGVTTWRAHFTDPDTRREVAVTLDASLSTREARIQWAKAKSRELGRRRMNLALGARRIEPKKIEDAITLYLETAEVTLKATTIKNHETAFAKLREWVSLHGIKTTIDLAPGRLSSLRDHIIRAPKMNVKVGGRRGTRRASLERRSNVTINRELRSLKTLLNTWRKRGYVSLHKDEIFDALAPLPIDRDEPTFYAPSTLKKLLKAAMRHDADCFTETRREHAGQGRRGSTPRYAPIAPFFAFLLLTGCRRGEALQLTWDAVDLDAVDRDGRKVGEIRLVAAMVKTKRGRTIGLEVSPALRRLLAALKLQTGGEGHVFGGLEPYTKDLVVAAGRRMQDEYGAPKFQWKHLRSTCGTYLTNAPGIFGAATVFLSAKQLGHSVAVAERHYLGVHRGIQREARDLETAMQISPELSGLLESTVARPTRRETG